MSTSEQAIIDEILADARKQAERIVKRAKRDAEGAVSRAREIAEKDAVQIVEAGRAQAAIKARAISSGVDQEIKKRDLAAREAIIDHVRDTALKVLAERERDQNAYRAALAGLIVDAVRQMAGDRFLVAFRAQEPDAVAEGALAAALERLAAEHKRPVSLERAPKPIRAAGGCIVQSADGRELANETFEERLRRLWPGIREEVAAMLFPDRVRKAQGGGTQAA